MLFLMDHQACRKENSTLSHLASGKGLSFVAGFKVPQSQTS